ncbi:TetR family transcriptional regulator [Paraburkholderia elongata]|uniref:TetR family transcriptional regulator n=1 Tax=Paraburkholderia elongata TaxID=2675747 RepID=A0A972NU71_9BURK|nr:TetR family transcriptional regulator [Paraburkholderia elongata]NPT57725.1 TetR family transcriptional regulator [Paraburkholderia elongata]
MLTGHLDAQWKQVMKRTLEHATRTRAKILDSAAQTFLRRGLARASLSDIARVAGVTRGAVYGHFKNKSALFNAMFEHATLPADPFLVEWHDNQRDPLSHLKSELIRLLGNVLRNGKARRLYSVIHSRCEITRETRDFWHKVHAGRKLAEQRIATALRDARSNLQLPDGIDVEQLAIFVHSCLMGVFVRSLGEPVSQDPGQVAERVVALVFCGLSVVQNTSVNA